MNEPIAWSRPYFDRIADNPERDMGIPNWAYRVIRAHPLHPTISALLNKFAPANWRELMAQWPHVSMKDPARLAYTPNEKYASSNRVLVTSPGKYVAKHWPNVPAHELRDMTLLTTSPSEMYFVRTTVEMILAIEYGPPSCMASSSPWCGHLFKHASEGFGRLADWVLDPSNNPEPEWALHPYASYKPGYGWHMALRKEDGIVQSRAVCLDFEGRKYFVRSYTHGTGENNSPSCETLNAWLKEQGYLFADDWPDGALLDIGADDSGGTRAPYLDGNSQRVDHVSGFIYKTSGYGEYIFADTGGGYDVADSDDDDEDSRTCDHCGDSCHIDDMYYAGRHDDWLICPACRRRHYVTVDSDNDREYLLSREYARPVESRTGMFIDPDFLPEHVIWLENQEVYGHIDDCAETVEDGWFMRDDPQIVECENGEWRLRNDPEIVQCADGEWRMEYDCWMDDETRKWYATDVHEPIEQPDGKLYHQSTVDALRKVDQLELL